jgi:hypothetical protein
MPITRLMLLEIINCETLNIIPHNAALKYIRKNNCLFSELLLTF